MGQKYITVTGVDESTKLEDIQNLLDQPNTEVGFLYTKDPEGRHRYPSRDWLTKALPLLKGRKALHICGGRAREELFFGVLDDLVEHVWRIQVNGGFKNILEVYEICNRFKHHDIITQHNTKNDYLRSVPYANHMILVDGSGGRGISPEVWTRPVCTQITGYAGGMGPDNILTELPKIDQIAQANYWIDMEGKLRSEDDWFQCSLALDVINKFNQFLKK